VKILLAAAALLFLPAVAPAKAKSEIQPQPQPDLATSPEPSAPEQHLERAGRRFWILAAIQVGATVADGKATP
jgi:hypothetical protein